MDQKKIEDALLMLTEGLTRADNEIAQLQTEVRVLQAALALQISPDDPQAALKQFENIAKTLVDSAAPQRQRLLEEISALKLVRKLGPHEA
jgi:HPt (histidine-containing phosphotransfer) domain-containing protein